MSRDMTLYKDGDERAYLVYTSENNQTMHVCQLAANYLKTTTLDKRILINESREAPALFKHEKKYYLITSGTTGWSPNKAQCAVADAPLGNWKEQGNPLVGPGADTTFGGQGTFVLPIAGKKNTYIFMADLWNKTDLQTSRYIWLPLKIKDNKAIVHRTPQFHSPVLKQK